MVRGLGAEFLISACEMQQPTLDCIPPEAVVAPAARVRGNFYRSILLTRKVAMRRIGWCDPARSWPSPALSESLCAAVGPAAGVADLASLLAPGITAALWVVPADLLMVDL